MKMPLNPPVYWAQRKDLIYVSIQLEDIQDENISIDNNKLEFSCKAGTIKQDYHVELKFHKEIVPEESKQRKLGREYFFQIAKKQTGAYWPRLLENSVKPSFLKVDFNRWKDEDDSDVDDGFDDQSLEDMVKQIGGDPSGFDPGAAPDSDDTDDEGLPGLE